MDKHSSRQVPGSERTSTRIGMQIEVLHKKRDQSSLLLEILAVNSLLDLSAQPEGSSVQLEVSSG